MAATAATTAPAPMAATGRALDASVPATGDEVVMVDVRIVGLDALCDVTVVTAAAAEPEAAEA